MNLIHINTAACLVICAWATWCILSPTVKDGVFGKALFSAVAVAALAVVLGPGYGYDQPQAPGVTLHVCGAALVMRQLVLRAIRQGNKQ